MASGFTAFTQEEQDPKAVEKVYQRISDLLSRNEEIHYIAIQKRPAVSLLPDSVVCTNRRIFINSPGNLGLTMNYVEFSWDEVKDVTMKEEIFGAKIIVNLKTGTSLQVDFIPKIQARKVYRFARESIEAGLAQAAVAPPAPILPSFEPDEPAAEKPQIHAVEPGNPDTHHPRHDSADIGSFDEFPDMPSESIPLIDQTSSLQASPSSLQMNQDGSSKLTENEVSQKLAQLKSLFERQLITRDDYETKKSEILSRFL